MNAIPIPTIDYASIKTRQQATWNEGDYGQVACWRVLMDA